MARQPSAGLNNDPAPLPEPIEAATRVRNVCFWRNCDLQPCSCNVCFKERRHRTRWLAWAQSGPSVVQVPARATSRQRRRFTVAHEVGHFLSPWHDTTVAGGFACAPQDLRAPWQVPSKGSRHQIQESEANRFAIELLAPRGLIRPKLLRGTPDLEQVIELARDLDISREASARRWLELRNDGIALVFGKDGLVRYVARSPEFPFVTLRKKEQLPVLPIATDPTGLSGHEDADWRDWLGSAPAGELVIQALHQREGFTIALLAIDSVDDD
jgi:hypothetical protein